MLHYAFPENNHLADHHQKLFNSRKIGIWGFGVVGKSTLTYIDQFQPTSIDILDTKTIKLPTTKNITRCIQQTPETIATFLATNDLILVSPGIKLHDYQEYGHKFINELDLLHKATKNSIIAITGTIGKTSITHLLEKIIQHTYPKTIAAGNIGNPMLSLITNPQEHAILELSSFQLQPIQAFAPDLAIITNFYPNHLDHHQTIDEYFRAKCNILRYQTEKQQALLPLDLMDQITSVMSPHRNWNLCSANLPTDEELNKYGQHTIYYLDEMQIYQIKNGCKQQIFNITTLPVITFDTNWLIIIAACHLYNIPLTSIAPAVNDIQLPDHRLQKIGSFNGLTFYNDSKSTVWQATLQAVKAMDATIPLALFLGGLSKGADRKPLIEGLRQHTNIKIYAFGKEAQQIVDLCKAYHIPAYNYQTLDEAFDSCMQQSSSPTTILLSPGGSSFDLFADYQARGIYFTQLVQKYR